MYVLKNVGKSFWTNIHVCIKECGKEFLDKYSLGKVGFVCNALAHVEKSRLALVQSDTWPN